MQCSSRLERKRQGDRVVTHTAPLHYLQLLAWIDPLKKKDPTARMLNRFHDLLTFDSWYCGHFHQDMEVGRLRIVMNDVIKIDGKTSLPIGTIRPILLAHQDGWALRQPMSQQAVLFGKAMLAGVGPSWQVRQGFSVGFGVATDLFAGGLLAGPEPGSEFIHGVEAEFKQEHGLNMFWLVSGFSLRHGATLLFSAIGKVSTSDAIRIERPCNETHPHFARVLRRFRASDMRPCQPSPFLLS